MPDVVIAGRYRLDELLGRSGMSEVWRAEDLELGRHVAIKLLAPDADTARFEREARAVASLAHPNITQLYDYGQEAGRPYMVLEYVPGGTLESRLRGAKPLPDDETQAIAAAVAAGLAHAHARGVVHRDLKPANVLFDAEGRPKIADFGIARLAVGEGTLTEAGTVLGTAAYISPEQATGDAATPASDVYSFGVILYRMLTGRLPFEADDPLELVTLHRDAPPPPIARFRSDAPARLEAVAAAALAKAPSDRPHDGAALLAALGVAAGADATAAATQVLPADPTRVLPRAAGAPASRPPSRKRPVALVLGALLLVLAVGGAALAYALASSSSPPQTETTVPPSTLETTSRATTAETTVAPTTQPSTQETTTAQPTTQRTTTVAPTTTTAPTTTAAPPVTTQPATTETLPATLPTVTQPIGTTATLP
jgi:serine/threonine-protein kinase